jgi:hypothetical protein
MHTEKEMTTENPERTERYPSDDVEGLDNEQAGGVNGYPIDSLMIRTDRRTVFEVCRRIEQKVYVLDPEFQREFIWDEVKQSRLIESAMMRIPLPVFYLAETADGKIVVVDGLQRLSTFRRFLADDLRLKGLVYAADMNGKRFTSRRYPKPGRRHESDTVPDRQQGAGPSQGRYFRESQQRRAVDETADAELSVSR